VRLSFAALTILDSMKLRLKGIKVSKSEYTIIIPKGIGEGALRGIDVNIEAT
jgi:hypothetical protein